MMRAELREPPHGYAVFLVEPGEFEPELTLRGRDRDGAAGGEHSQGGVTVGRQPAHGHLELPQLFEDVAG